MAQVAIIVNGSADPRKSEISRALGILLGCPVLDPAPLDAVITTATGPVVAADDVQALAVETVWRTVGLVEAGVVVDGVFAAGDREAVSRGIELGGGPRVVEVWCGEPGGELGLSPVVQVPDVAAVDMDALVQEIGELFD
ncbi:hypothetical protein AX769_06810 [Frondihabitans sp. PAMC 28766]|uniref:hypothetical protein n=1 Tax=Frondihabitans sp. PAMC 28766 TaxID=1795630 RepID=UPI00078B2457|nr:hypothetical protein [Frondihabitans sp. PAMC 28766]AMM19920.1 hypothetical protein AX769_06810 [Frondihabitans sp. PAMC 28766]